MGNSHSHSHSREYDYEAHDRRWEEKVKEEEEEETQPGIELDKNTRNIRDPALRATLQKTVWVVSQHPRHGGGGGPNSIRLTIPMGDLVPPLSLYARASRPDVTQAELDAIGTEMREFETWAYGEYMGRVRRMARESGAGGGGGGGGGGGYVSGSRSRSKRGRGGRGGSGGDGGVSFLSGQTTYLPPGVERYKPLRIPAVVAGGGGRIGSGSGSGSGGGSQGGGGGGAEEGGEDEDEVAGGDGEAGAEATEGGEGTAATTEE